MLILIFECQVLLRMHGAIYCRSDVDLFNYLPRHSHFHLHATRNSENLVVPFFHRSKTQRSIFYIGPQLWNALPIEVKMLSSFSSFGRNIRINMLEDY